MPATMPAPTSLTVTTGDFIEGRRISQYLGVVRGIAVRLPTISQGFQALGNVLSGNVQASGDMFAEICEAARAQAYQRLVDHALELGADAIIAMRYDANDIGESASEVLAYGTAVKLKPLESAP